MTKGQSTLINFVMERETKGTIRYKEVDEKGTPLNSNNGAKIGTLYIRKTALGKDVPQKLNIAITPA